MRRSIFDDDQRRFSVTLNGKPLTDVICADDELGQAEIWEHEWSLNLRGQRVIDGSVPGSARRLHVTGNIQIVNHPDETTPIANPFEGWGDYSA